MYVKSFITDFLKAHSPLVGATAGRIYESVEPMLLNDSVDFNFINSYPRILVQGSTVNLKLFDLILNFKSQQTNCVDNSKLEIEGNFTIDVKVLSSNAELASDSTIVTGLSIASLRSANDICYHIVNRLQQLTPNIVINDKEILNSIAMESFSDTTETVEGYGEILVRSFNFKYLATIIIA